MDVLKGDMLISARVEDAKDSVSWKQMICFGDPKREKPKVEVFRLIILESFNLGLLYCRIYIILHYITIISVHAGIVYNLKIQNLIYMFFSILFCN